MNIKIRQTRIEPSFNFDVIVEEENTSTQHLVSMSKEFYNSLDTKKTALDVVRTIFEFLLDRETKEQILREFDVTVVSHYYPEFKEKLKEMLKNEWVL